MIFNKMSIGFIYECISRGTDMDDLGGTQRAPIHLLAAIINHCSHDNARLLMPHAIENGAMNQNGHQDIYQPPHQSVDVDLATSLPCIAIHLIFAAARRLAREGVPWPLDMSLEHGANVNEEATIVFRMERQGFTRK